MRTFDKNKLHYIPVIMKDWVGFLESENRPEVRESYAQRFEAIKEYCEYALALNEDKRHEALKNRR